MIDLWNYDTSPLNPAIKVLIVVIYAFVAFVYYRSRDHYAGDLYRVLGLLFWVATAAAIVAMLRYFGHGTDFGFTKQFSLKWFESLGYVVWGVLFILAARWLARGIIPDVKN
jgi:hypothetical protein